MSLLVPSECDYMDAHHLPDLESNYQQKLEAEKSAHPEKYPWSFEVVPGFFRQSDADTDDLHFRYTECNMGRKKPWAQITSEICELNEKAPDNVVYKLIICARHGQGYHNWIVDEYGVDAWNEKWYALGTDGKVEYGPDPMLTELGIRQAKENHDMWAEEVNKHGAPIPSKFYVSPLQRSCWTCVETFSGIRPDDRHPMIIEKLRETIGQNLCDKRSTKSVIESRFAKYGFVTEPGFTEEDLLHNPRREEPDELAMRVNLVCQKLFDEDWDEKRGAVDETKAVENWMISTTTHAGTIRLFIVVFGNRRFTLSTGGMIPMVVKATRN